MVIFEPAWNVTRPYEWFIYVNTVTSNSFGFLILIALFIVSFVSMLKWGFARSFASSSTLTSIIAIFFWLMKILSWQKLSVCLILTAGSIVLLQIQLKKGA